MQKPRNLKQQQQLAHILFDLHYALRIRAHFDFNYCRQITNSSFLSSMTADWMKENDALKNIIPQCVSIKQKFRKKRVLFFQVCNRHHHPYHAETHCTSYYRLGRSGFQSGKDFATSLASCLIKKLQLPYVVLKAHTQRTCTISRSRPRSNVVARTCTYRYVPTWGHGVGKEWVALVHHRP